jgi:hypothetical protein
VPNKQDLIMYIKDHPDSKTSDLVNHYAGPPQDAVTAREVKLMLLNMWSQGEIQYDWDWKIHLKP